MTRYGELKMLERDGQIHDLVMQPRVRCEVNGVLICDYAADFAYTEKGQKVFEKSKGVRTAVCRLKKNLVRVLTAVCSSPEAVQAVLKGWGAVRSRA